MADDLAAREYGLYVGGQWREPGAGRYDDLSPGDGRAFAQAPDASVQDVQDAVGAAREAFDSGPWGRMPAEDRAKCLRQLADALGRHLDAFTDLARREWGATNDLQPQVQAGPHVVASILATLEAGLAEPIGGRMPGVSATLHHRPHGVVAALTPWNYPHVLNLVKIVPALAAGNTVVLKPSPVTPLAGLALAALVAEETDLPAGVLNVVPTRSVDAARALTTDPRVDMVSFTGSTAVGREIQAAAAPLMKRVLLELGGKSAAIVLDDADLDAFAEWAAYEACTRHAGQVCHLLSRVLVPQRRYDEVVTALADRVSAVPVGDPFDPAVRMGPLVSDVQLERVGAMVEQARTEGATVVTGGGRPDGVPDGGYYYAPTVLAGVTPEMTIARQEVFGPVVSVLPYTDVEDAVTQANASPYGLIGAVWGGDADAASAVGERIRAGQISVNGAFRLGPFGGYGDSGIGREGGREGLLAYTEMQAVSRPA